MILPMIGVGKNKIINMKFTKLKFYRAFLYCTFPFSVLIANFVYGYKFYQATHRRVGQRLANMPGGMNSEEFFLKRCKAWQRNYPKFKKIKLQILDVKYKDQMVQGFNEVNLSVRTYQQKTPSDKWVILLHGWTENKFELLHIADMYWKLGFNVMLYDARAHGESQKEHFFSTIGYLEKFDLVEMIRWLNKTHQAQNIVLHGESMGAATIVEACKIIEPDLQKYVKACILDGCFDNLYFQMQHAASREFPVHSIFYKYGIKSWFFNKDDYDLRDVQPASFLNYLPLVPFYIIHGDNDKSVPLQMGRNIYEEKINFEKKRISEMWIVKNGTHTESFQIDPNDYTSHIKQFLAKKI